MKKKLFAALFICCGLLSCSDKQQPTADYRIVPLPQEIVEVQADGFTLNGTTAIVYEGDAEMKRNAEFLAEFIKEKTALELTVTDVKCENAITLKTGEISDNAEAYAMNVTADGIEITGATPAGVFYGMQTLRKALPIVEGGEIHLPAVAINDYPRFSYRGAHLDVSRHFFTTDSIKRFVDMLALHNLNRFHWHLTDDQGWRIEIKKYPKLTTVAAERDETVIGRNSPEYDGKHYGPFFYTQEECREIVEYAAERHITVIPEIDLPGHMQAALAAYPEYGCTGGPYEVWKMWGVSDNVLCAGNDATLSFIEDILSEVIEVFPSEYIHIGGDECPKTQWEKCPKCQARIKALGIKGDDKHTAEMYLQSFVINHAEKFLNSKGRQIIGWDEILEGGLAPNATVHSWRGVEGGIEAAKQGHDCIMSPTTFMYFDYYQTKDVEGEPLAIGGYVPVERVYSFDPQPAHLTPEEQKHIIGVQANLWTEYVPTYSHVEYMLMPRMAALCEVQWSAADKKDYEDFLGRLPQLVEIYDMKQYNYATHVFDITAKMTPDTEEEVLKVAFKTIDNSPIYYTLDGTEPTAQSEKYTDTLKINQACTIKAIAIRPTGNSRVFQEEINIHKASFKPITMLQPINRQYEFDGAGTLLDGLKGNHNYKTGRWIAFFKNDMEAVIDLKQPTEFSTVSISTLVEKGDWVFDARRFAVSTSEDGENFTEVAAEDYPAMTLDNPNQIYEHTLDFMPVTARYIKVYVQPEHSLPDWHGGKGHPSFVFLDEITVN